MLAVASLMDWLREDNDIEGVDIACAELLLPGSWFSAAGGVPAHSPPPSSASGKFSSAAAVKGSLRESQEVELKSCARLSVAIAAQLQLQASLCKAAAASLRVSDSTSYL